MDLSPSFRVSDCEVLKDPLRALVTSLGGDGGALRAMKEPFQFDACASPFLDSGVSRLPTDMGDSICLDVTLLPFIFSEAFTYSEATFVVVKAENDPCLD